MTSRAYRNIFSRHFTAEKFDVRVRQYNLGMMIPFLESNEVKVYNEEEYTNDLFLTESILIFPLNPAYLHFFLIKPGTKKKNLYGLISVLNF